MMLERLAPEQHDSLPGIPEPAENPRLIGHRNAREILAGAYVAGRLPHAVLLAGPQGIGKATLAFHFANHVLRFRRPEEAPADIATPDPASPLFRQIATGAHPGVLHLTRPANDKGKGFKTVLTVDEIRKVNRFLSLTAHDGGYRVAIVDAADDMNVNAANALLKNIEEPPQRTVFILISNSLGRLLPTIRSRCQTILMQPLPDQEVAAVLAGFGGALPEDDAARRRLLERAGGSPRNAILLTDYGGFEISEVVDRLVAGPILDVAEAFRLAEAISGRESAMQLEIFNRRVLDLLSDAAAQAAAAGEGHRANRLSEAWQEASRIIADNQIFNLDKKQHVLGLIQMLHQTLRP